MPISSQTCFHQCKCDAMCSARTYILEDQAIQFSTGLNDSFSIVKIQFLLLETLPFINKIYSLIAQEERNITPTPTFEASNLVTNAFDAKRGLGRGNLFTHCNKHGHAIDFCYQKHISLKFINLHHLLMLILILFKMARLQVTQLIHKFMWTLHLLSLHKSMTSLYVCYNMPT